MTRPAICCIASVKELTDPMGHPDGIADRRRDYNVRGQPMVDYANEYVDGLFYKGIPPAGKTSCYSYHANGQIAHIEMPDGGRFRARYLPNRIEKWDANTLDGDFPVIERYSAQGYLIELEQPDGSGGAITTRYHNDAQGRTTQIVDANGRTVARYIFGGLGAPIRIEHAALERGRTGSTHGVICGCVRIALGASCVLNMTSSAA